MNGSTPGPYTVSGSHSESMWAASSRSTPPSNPPGSPAAPSDTPIRTPIPPRYLRYPRGSPGAADDSGPRAASSLVPRWQPHAAANGKGPAMTLPAGAPCWIDLLTPDPERASHFYTELFGWTAGEAAPEFGG